MILISLLNLVFRYMLVVASPSETSLCISEERMTIADR